MKWICSSAVIVLFCIAGSFALPHPDSSNKEDPEPVEKSIEDIAREYLLELDRKSSEKCHEASEAEWNYATDINDKNEEIKLKIGLEHARFAKEAWNNLTKTFQTWRNFQDPDLLRMFKKSIILGSAALPDDKLKEYNQLETDMSKIYSTTKVCAFYDKEKCNLSLEPDLSKIMKESRDEKELRHAWTEWHDKCGTPIKEKYVKFVELSNEAAKLNDFPDTGAYWLHEYEQDTFKDDVEDLWRTLKPLYQEMHAYVRAKLADFYPDQFLEDDGLIPAHLLGNMWSQSWSNVYSLMIPYPDKPSVDVTEEMKKQGYTPLKMFQKSDEFFTSLGLIPMPKEFWEKSMLEKPKDREVVCHASAWDLCNGVDYRIKQCTVVSTNQFVTVHHEMGHTQYQIQYKHLPLIYRTGANPGFHEAIGDTLALSVKTPKHFKEIGLLDADAPVDDYETSINFLFQMAMDSVANLPFTFLLDKYRWSIFDGSVGPSEYNAYWWKLRKGYQGVKPPSERNEEQFDAGAKFHVPANVEYLRYFVANVIQFQFHRALCKEAGQYDPEDPSKPLHNCDIYKSKKAGSKLAAGLKMGASRPWPEVMKVITGEDKMDASAIREYFKPLEDWLKKENAKLGIKIGWKKSL